MQSRRERKGRGGDKKKHSRKNVYILQERSVCLCAHNYRCAPHWRVLTIVGQSRAVKAAPEGNKSQLSLCIFFCLFWGFFCPFETKRNNAASPLFLIMSRFSKCCPSCGFHFPMLLDGSRHAIKVIVSLEPAACERE